ncbi:MAG: tRNA (adenosine(37)-N6)-threonylcarbamoyltransferase complex dimerization subunit type 1 TsaB [Ignavibacteriaceae bacterium]|nr:tRNA (adenosine(37)-N6)-threonylcarbamoyltransferase complex dimerization subunit type 1 TsaB [Ignavibacteriaceae bacterium]
MDLSKPILSIETSGSLCGASVYIDDAQYYTVNVHQKNIHAERLFSCIDDAIRQSSLTLNDIGAIAVSAGPGSFTGLRIGMSAAKGLAFGSGLPIIPVPTFEALAFQISTYLKDEAEFIIANKVNIEEIYFAKFKVTGNSYIFAEDLQIIHKEEFLTRVGDDLVYGSACSDFNNYNFKSGVSVSDSFYIAKWSRYFGHDKILYDYDYLEPNYLKNLIIQERKNA